MTIKLLSAVLIGLLLGACRSPNYLDRRYEPDRADFGDQVLPVPAEAPQAAPSAPDSHAGAAQTGQEQITGTWTFTVPPTVTQVERKASDYMQYSLYNGRPAPSDTPFVVITISADPRTLAQSDPATYHVAEHREYALNGNVAQEWSGNTKTGAGFSELLIRKPGGKGDLCHVMATAKTQEERKLSLDILGSIAWWPVR